MANSRRKDWEDLNITKEEVENLTQALKKEEFRKLLSEYAEEITDPKNRKQYQDDIVKLEAERGVDCTFVNPEPGFVVKTSVGGNKKAFINICKNKAVGRPSSEPEVKNNSRGLSWSIPLCQAPGREDFDKKRNRCVVYDVVFHPETLSLAEKNPQFKKLVIETALNAVEDSYNVNLDKKNFKLPKLTFKGLPFATVIRKKSKNQPVITEEDNEYFNMIKYPFKTPSEAKPIIKNFENKKPDVEKYTIPKYVIKHQSDVDLQEFTYDKNAKINAAIPKQLVIEVNLPLLNSTQTVTLDIMKKTLHLLCDKPAKYKLDIQLPYSVDEETGNAKFDKDRRLLIITLPVIKAKMSIKDLMRDDSGVESDLSPVGSVSNTEFPNSEENNLTNDSANSFSVVENSIEVLNEEFETGVLKIENEMECRTKEEVEEFLECDKHYILPGFSCNIDGNNICFVLNVKNVDSDSLVKKIINSHACHIKFFTLGSGFFPVYHAFYIDFREQCCINDVICETWDNNMTVLIEFEKNGEAVTKYYVGLNEDSLTQYFLNHPLELKMIMDEKLSEEYDVGNDNDDDDDDDDEDDDDDDVDDNGNNDVDESHIKVESASVDEVVVSIIPKKSENSDSDLHEENQNFESSSSIKQTADEKCRTLSESGVDEIVVSSYPLARKSILKKRISRSLSESNADDYVMSSSIDKAVSDGSDLCILEEQEVPYIKKTVRFSEKIRQQLFRVNSSILGRKNRNRKKNRCKKRAMERKVSESENSENDEKEKDENTKTMEKPENNSLIQVISNSNGEEKENCKATNNEETLTDIEKKEKSSDCEEESPRRGLKKDDRIFEFKSDLIFDLDF